MLDLNLDMVSSESSCDENMNDNKVKVLASMEDSGSTKSSIINDEDVLKETDDATVGKKVENPFPEFVTRQLFPVIGEKSGVELEFGVEPLAGRAKWLNLSYADGTGEAEMMTVPVKPQPKKSRRGPRSRSSQYRGVTFYRRTGRWESHIWDCGKQVYLGGFDTAHAAARAYDRVAIKFRGVEADINFTLSDYEEDMKHMKHMSKEEFVHALRRQSNGFSRGNSKYRGITLHKCGRWEAQMGQFVGKKAYDMAATKSTYEGGGKCDHNLDLSLGISAPPVAGNRIDDARDSILRDIAERTISRRADAASWIGYSNSTWQMQGDGKIISSTPVFPIAAASSGFSSSIAIASSTTLPFDKSGWKSDTGDVHG